MSHRRLPDLLKDAEFLLVQLVMLHQSGGPHLIRERAQRLGALHRKLDQVERELRIHGEKLGVGEGLTLGALRRRLAQLTDRRSDARPHAGPERRHSHRRLREPL